MSEELKFAMRMAIDYWPGVSMTEGAYALMEHVRCVSPEQFTQSQIEERGTRDEVEATD